MNYQILFYVGLAGAVITLSISILLFIKLNIAQVIEDLTGFRLTKVWKGKNHASGRSEKALTKEIILRKKVEKEAAAGLEPTALLEDVAASTELLVNGRLATELLEETTLLHEEETSLLSEGVDKTAVLTPTPAKGYIKDVDIMIVHTENVIK